MKILHSRLFRYHYHTLIFTSFTVLSNSSTLLCSNLRFSLKSLAPKSHTLSPISLLQPFKWILDDHVDIIHPCLSTHTITETVTHHSCARIFLSVSAIPHAISSEHPLSCTCYLCHKVSLGSWKHQTAFHLSLSTCNILLLTPILKSLVGHLPSYQTFSSSSQYIKKIFWTLLDSVNYSPVAVTSITTPSLHSSTVLLAAFQSSGSTSCFCPRLHIHIDIQTDQLCLIIK